jgi:hypothetical protein
MKLNQRELATILAALRNYQTTLEACPSLVPTALLEISTDRGILEPLTSEEIDDLCHSAATLPDRFQRLMDAVCGQEESAIRDAAIRAGILWKCRCRFWYDESDSDCPECGAKRQD